MSQPPFMQLYVADYLADTQHLTTEQHGAYLLLLMTMWRSGATLPNDSSKLARIARVSAKRWPQIWAEIEELFVAEEGTISNRRLTKEHQKAVSISQERKTAGRKGGASKALKSQDAGLANASDLPKHSQISDTREEKEELNSSSKKRACRLPEEWQLPSDWEDWAVDQGMKPDAVQRESDKFRDYWIGKSGSAATKADWQATWRNWVRSALERSPQSTNRTGQYGGSGPPMSERDRKMAFYQSVSRKYQ